MTVLLLALVMTAAPVAVEVRRAEVPPRIDGRIEELWFQADTVDRFVQHYPQEGAEPSERTEVFILQDDERLYIAVRAWALTAPPLGQLLGLEDEITLLLDPMDSKSMGYFFKLYGSGIQHSGLILENGANWDWSWEGVWYGAVRLYPDRLEAEFAIPFKSIRYNPAATGWGFDVERVIARERESVRVVEVREAEGGLMVSNFARLEGVAPRAQGYYFELFPEGYVRYDQQEAGESGRVKPFASLNLKWDPSPRTTLNGTVLPDFAQIESDPYSFNISRYPVMLGERRPFFIEGSELFRTTGAFGMYSPLRLFYSRRVGRPVAGEPVPILAGLKFTTRSSERSMGLLGAYTDEVSDGEGRVIEPRRGFAVLSGRTGLPDNTSLGLQFAGTAAGAEDYNYVLGSGWSMQSGSHRGAVEAAVSNHNARLGWALNSGYFGQRGIIQSYARLDVVSDSFSVGDIGYVPWAGRKLMGMGIGPLVRGRGRQFRSLGIMPGAFAVEHPGSNRLSCGLNANSALQFRDWGLSLYGEAGQAFEADTGYLARQANIYYWGNSLRHSLHFGLGGSHGWNYRRDWLAASYSSSATFTYNLFGRVALGLSGNNWWECDPAGGIVEVTSVVRPRIDYRVNARTTLNLYNELVFSTPGTDFGSSQLASSRLGLLFSWNFRPKSWLYLALNETSADRGEGLELAGRVAAVKLRYLFQF